MFKLEIDTSNDAFQPFCQPEIEMILRSLAQKIRQSRRDVTSWNLYDRNGNKVGKAELTP